MEKDKLLLEGVIADYYNSIEERFHYRQKNDWKIELTDFLRMLSLLFFIFNVIPFFPLISGDYFKFVLDFLETKTQIPDLGFNFYISWGFGVIISIVILGLVYIPYKIWDIRDTKRALNYKLMKFCYAYSLRKDLKSYLINENPLHLEKSVKRFTKVIRPIITFSTVERERTISIGLMELQAQLKKQFDWIEFSSDTSLLISSLEHIEVKVNERLKQKTELKELLPILDALTLYEFSKLKPNIETEDKVRLANRRTNYIVELSKQIKNLEQIEPIKSDSDKRKIIKIAEFFRGVSSLFSSSNPIVMFISWLVLLAIAFALPTLLLIKAFLVEVDATVLISIASVPFVGAITLVATIYSKNKN